MTKGRGHHLREPAVPTVVGLDIAKRFSRCILSILSWQDPAMMLERVQRLEHLAKQSRLISAMEARSSLKRLGVRFVPAKSEEYQKYSYTSNMRDLLAKSLARRWIRLEATLRRTPLAFREECPWREWFRNRQVRGIVIVGSAPTDAE